MADCDNFENAMACAEAGADFVGTTMRGYTPETQGINDIDFDFVHKLATECPAKIIAEGHIHYPEQAVKALEAGAFALVVGGDHGPLHRCHQRHEQITRRRFL